MFIDALPPGEKWSWGETDGPPTIIDIDRVHPLTQFVDMNYVKIAEGRKLTPPLGSTVLFDSVIGPLFAIGPREGFEDAVLGFPLLTTDSGETVPNTTWPLRPSFPVFIYNAVRYLGGNRGSSSVTNYKPGEAVTLRVPTGAEEISVISPSGRRTHLRRGGQNTFVFTDTQSVGVYDVRHDESDFAQRFVVNLFDTRESNIHARQKVELGHETVVASPQLQVTRRELWKWILLLGLIILGAEWYVYNRRVYL